MEAAAARLGMELIKQYPAKEQAELKVKVKIPGSWFGGRLTTTTTTRLSPSPSPSPLQLLPALELQAHPRELAALLPSLPAEALVRCAVEMCRCAERKRSGLKIADSQALAGLQ